MSTPSRARRTLWPWPRIALGTILTILSLRALAAAATSGPAPDLLEVLISVALATLGVLLLVAGINILRTSST